MTQPVLMYTTGICPYCQMARRLFSEKGVKYTEIRVDQNPAKRSEMMEKSGQRTVPQIWIGDKHVGGFDDAYALQRKGKLDALLKEQK